MSVIKGIQEDMNEAIKKEQFDIIMADIEFLKKDLGKLCTKEELVTRLNVFNSDINTKLSDRPTIIYFKKVLSAYDTKIDSFNFALNDHIMKLDKA